MNVLVFEWFCGGGCWLDGCQIESDLPTENVGGLLQQGLGMLVPILVDLTQAGHRPVTLLDSRLISIVTQQLPSSVQIIPVDSGSEVASKLQEQTLRCDGTMLIAPETDGCLVQAIQWLGALKTRLVSPDPSFVQLTSNKQDTIEYLTSHGVPCPYGLRRGNLNISDFLNSVGKSLRFPLVAKPVDGAGSCDVVLIETPESLASVPCGDRIRIENFCEGLAASVSVICHANRFQLLPPTEQLFDASPFGNYAGAKYPLQPALEQRARQLAHRTMLALPETRGYVGIDMILSNQSSQDDVVLEVNPRFTMSYSRLREICDFNIADRILEKG